MLTGAVAGGSGTMVDAICAERGLPVISQEIQPDESFCRHSACHRRGRCRQAAQGRHGQAAVPPFF
ncbi:hypothetical protein MPNT_210014 [Candidatus Methylacidithermus pantelleriae]|uniref:Uncharacterized protein n=1 Tax=Candidatus Methylacidithermus pantelleriae TaxID=2744239 RepID=A0A8J2FPR1_9BACT|nr:hypothetical protein MPNT_210014 [Candidatus Methylacidithermus pantelleriae]